MRVGRGDAERLKASRLPPHPPQCAHWGTCPYPLCPFGTSSLPLLAFGHFPLTGGIGPLTRGVGPLWGEGFGSAQIGRDLPFCGTFGYIYWEFGRSAPVRGRAARCAALQERLREPAPSSAPFGGTFPPGGRLRKKKEGQVWDLSLKTQRRSGASHKISLPPFFFKERRGPGAPAPGPVPDMKRR